MKIMPKLLAVTSVVLFATSFGAAAAQKNRIEITDCVCDETNIGTYDCTVSFDGALPADISDEYHAHVTTEQEGVLDSDGVTPASCKAKTECGGSIGADPSYTATCTGAPLPDSTCTDLLEEGFSFGIVAKVAADADEDHGNAKRVLKDNYPHCTINEWVDPV